MKLAVYTYNAEPFTWYPSPRVAFVDFSRNGTGENPIWKKADPGRDGWISPMDLLPCFDAWLWVDSRIDELTIDFDELQYQIDPLDRNKIYGVGRSENGFRTIGVGCLSEPDAERNEKLLDFIYETAVKGARKYSPETPLRTFSAILFLRSPKTENACREAAEMTRAFRELNPQVALNWTAWKNTVGIEEIEDLRIQPVRHKIWISSSDAAESSRLVPRQPEKPPRDESLSKPRHAAGKQTQIPTVDPLGQDDELKNAAETFAAAMPEEDENDGNGGSIDNEFLLKLAAASRGAASAASTPSVSIMMTTWNRTPLAVKCLKGLVENVDYPLQKLYWIIADDGSEPGHVEACIDALTSSGVSIDKIYAVRNYRSGTNAKFGHALNLNNGLREAFKHSDIVLRTEDDLLPSRKIPVGRFAEILQKNKNVAGIKLGHAEDVSRKLPWKGDPKNFMEDASYWNVFIFNHLAMICHKRAYDALGMYNEKLSGAEVEKDIGKRFMEKFRRRTPEQEYAMKVLSPVLAKPDGGGDMAKWFYFTHIGKDSVSGHYYRTEWSDDVIKLNSEELAEDIRSESAKM